ncbi:N-acetylmuramoyl-L-alanine amidase [Solidesulfovibrio sp.]|uniref:N-acetylmuramoyl-L-alanine amidase n=1 Tax=Solidesulfovibrio sp. TaxID=2910990 RepID=UPI002B1FDF01|nr:N-acetylmuramoyl-L-alanine amidase [Solidesulfovibrio sp.]MEA5088480.1 N-acetylmuramoyl-L-alanine amidase [Solidesulfovibrio sp.]
MSCRMAAFSCLFLSCCLAFAAPARAESADELAREAQAALTGGETDAALALLKEAQGKDPRNDRVQALLGRAWLQRGDAREALAHFTMAVRINPEDTLSRIMAETIGQFPLPARDGKSVAPPPGRSRTLSADARAEREALLAKGPRAGREGPFRVCIDAGHGGLDPGAPGAGLREADVALDIALRLARVLSTKGDDVSVTLTRTADVTLPGWARAALAGFYDADLFVSIHAARVPEPAASGLAFYAFAREPSDAVAGAASRVENAAHESLEMQPGRLGAQSFFAAASRAAGTPQVLAAGRAARTMATAAAAGAPLPVRGAGAGPFRLLDEADAPAVLVEAGFLSHAADAGVLAAPEKRQALAEALGRAVLAAAAQLRSVASQ